MDKKAIDLGMVTHVCPCSSKVWRLNWVMFEDYEISAYSLDMECAICGCKAKAPTLADKPKD